MHECHRNLPVVLLSWAARISQPPDPVPAVVVSTTSSSVERAVRVKGQALNDQEGAYQVEETAVGELIRSLISKALPRDPRGHRELWVYGQAWGSGLKV